MKINICGVEIDQLCFNEVVEQIVEHVLVGKEPKYVVTPNAQHVVLLQSNFRFREYYRHAFLVVPDGVSLLWAAKFLQTSLKGRVNGTDLFEKLCAIASQKDLKIFFLGGRPGASTKAKEVLEKRYPSLQIVGTYCPPYGFESQPEELAIINSKIQDAKPDILFVGLGSPKQEFWIYDNYKTLNIPISIGIGVSFELVSNMVQRAPLWMQKSGLEWFFRLLVEPRRLWKRYIMGNPLFVLLVLKQRIGVTKFE